MFLLKLNNKDKKKYCYSKGIILEKGLLEICLDKILSQNKCDSKSIQNIEILNLNSDYETYIPTKIGKYLMMSLDEKQVYEFDAVKSEGYIWNAFDKILLNTYELIYIDENNENSEENEENKESKENEENKENKENKEDGESEKHEMTEKMNELILKENNIKYRENLLKYEEYSIKKTEDRINEILDKYNNIHDKLTDIMIIKNKDYVSYEKSISNIKNEISGIFQKYK